MSEYQLLQLETVKVERSLRDLVERVSNLRKSEAGQASDTLLKLQASLMAALEGMEASDEG